MCSLDGVKQLQVKTYIWNVRDIDQCDSLITLPVENDIHIADILYFYPPTVPDRDCFATGRRRPRILDILVLSCVI